jgi:hypothetical protein
MKHISFRTKLLGALIGSSSFLAPHIQANPQSQLEKKIGQLVQNISLKPETQCNLIGAFGQSLGILPNTLKKPICDKCSQFLPSKHPRAYAAVCGKPSPVTPSGPAQSTLNLKDLKTDDKKSFKYIPIEDITPGQLRYSALNVEEKKKAAIERKAVTGDATGGRHYKYNDDKSALAAEEALPVVLAVFGPVLVDGHHETLASIALGAKTIPVYVKKDLSNLSKDAFWTQAQQEGLVYPYTLENTHKIPTSFKELQNDPNRFFAALVARKCPAEGSSANETFAAPKTPLADYPVWIKVGKDIPFIEFKISDVLNKNKHIYDENWGTKVPEEFVETARQTLVSQPVPGLKVVPQRVKYDTIPNICIKEKK